MIKIKHFVGLLISFFMIFGGIIVLFFGLHKYLYTNMSPAFCIIGGIGGLLAGILLYSEIYKEIKNNLYD